ncbi:MAG: sigma-70 family RNA polymerase sigma factor [Myxococcales bacterium]|nr:sigma-70 family RNA polymerase sigma factor [Myxococcales bacterium]
MVSSDTRASDHALLDAWRGGDRRAGSALFLRHYTVVNRFFRTKVNAADVSDLVQNTFVACVEARERYEGTGTFRSYLLGIAFRLLCRHYRSKRSERARLDLAVLTASELAPSPSQVVAAQREQRLLLAALRRLSVEHQTLLELFYWEGFTAQASAEVLGIPLGTAKSRIRRARALLREQLERLADNPALLESTVMNLDGWARGLREQLE